VKKIVVGDVAFRYNKGVVITNDQRLAGKFVIFLRNLFADRSPLLTMLISVGTVIVMNLQLKHCAFVGKQ
jgi:hypothetical protein